MSERWDIVVAGLSITSSWGNGHATTYRGLLRELARLGHRILFLERDVPWYADNRDVSGFPFCQIGLYRSLEELRDRFLDSIRQCDAAILGSYVPEGVAVAELLLREARGLVAFYDIDTPITLAALRAGKCDYLAAETIPFFDLYLSFTGGPTLTHLETALGAQRARALYCSADETLYYPEKVRIDKKRWMPYWCMWPAAVRSCGSWLPGRSIQTGVNGRRILGMSCTCRPASIAPFTIHSGSH
jgi:spore maturation protein CgeB